ncbi:hypothetical protein T261_1841 [Streptomyces lydicus]|nr:hypothetical protein T261_1841 [Streptomyces lydicus]
MSMLLLKLSAKDLLALDRRDRLVPHLAARWKHFRGPSSEGEREAWAESLIELAKDLIAADRGDVQMLVECRPAGADAPVDVMLVGRHPGTGADSFQLIELKRWSSVTRLEADAAAFIVPGTRDPQLHPARQLGRFYEFLMGDRGPLRGLSVECGGFTYLHNARDESVRPLFGPDAPTGPCARCYTLDSREEMLKDLQEQIAVEGSDAAAERFLKRIGVRNSPLLDAMTSSRGEDTVFTLRGQQERVAQDVRDAVTSVTGDPSRAPMLTDAGQQAVFIVTGGAGSGKSAIGLQLMAEFEAKGLSVQYASGSRAFNAAMQDHVGFGDREFQSRFRYFSSYITPPEPRLDVLICDEAHRMRERSTNPRPWMPQGKQPQIDDLLDAARVTVFLLDTSQSVRPKEVGTTQLIEDAAKRRGIRPARYRLQKQFRCGGSDAYRQWVHALLGLSDDKPYLWRPDGLMHIEMANSPEELVRLVRTEFSAGASARIVAGFSWPWNKPVGKEKRLEKDVQIGGWEWPWNADSTSRCENGVPPSRLWGVRDEGFGQLGCVYTSQGLEWDWCGVIMGEDMVWRADRWVFQRGKIKKDRESGLWRIERPGSCDPKVIASSVDEDSFQTCVRNAYHVLLTRASRAAVVYSSDPETQEYLKTCVGKVENQGLRPAWSNLPEVARRPRSRRSRRGRGPSNKDGQQPGLFSL